MTGLRLQKAGPFDGDVTTDTVATRERYGEIWRAFAAKKPWRSWTRVVNILGFRGRDSGPRQAKTSKEEAQTQQASTSDVARFQKPRFQSGATQFAEAKTLEKEVQNLADGRILEHRSHTFYSMIK